MAARALIVVDIQNEYFPGGNLPLEGIEQAAENAARMIDFARKNQDLVVHIHHEMPMANAPIFAPGSDGLKINDAVAPVESEPVIQKHSPNAFLNTNLKEVLEENGVNEVLIVGAMSQMCIDATSRAAADMGYKLTVVHDACATRDLEFEGRTIPAAQVHDTIMAALEFAYGTVTTTKALTAA